MNIKKLIKDKFLPAEANWYTPKIYMNLLLNNAISRSATATLSRNIDPSVPATWEFSGFSQNGEDGIIQYLISKLKNSGKYFVEIGTGNGLENNTSYLGHISKFAGLQIEGNENFHKEALQIKPWLVECMNCFVDEATAETIYQKALFKDPDVFSLDIDGNDYYIAKVLLEKGLRPKIIVVEYNSAFGPEQSITIPYNPGFDMFATEFPYLYYGVSLAGWKNLFRRYGYEFITVETNGVNAFFIDPEAFGPGFSEGLRKTEFKENIHQLRLFRTDHIGQFEKIKDCQLVSI